MGLGPPFTFMVQKMSDLYSKFTESFQFFASENKEILSIALSNIFTMRMIGNKTHGDLAEIGITELINHFMPNYSAKHVGKVYFRKKRHEEDILVFDNNLQEDFTISLKAYGCGPLQLSTDKKFEVFPFLDGLYKEHGFIPVDLVKNFEPLKSIMGQNILPLIYNESENLCNAMVFDLSKSFFDIDRVELEYESRNRKHPVFKFFNKSGGYMFESRYGGPKANALQRGVWTHTRTASNYFSSLTNGWVSYTNNVGLIKLMGKLLLCDSSFHVTILEMTDNYLMANESEAIV